LTPDRTDFKRVSEFRVAVSQFYTQYPSPYGCDELARDYSPVGKKKLCVFGEQGDGPIQMNEPSGLAITSRESIIVCDTMNHRTSEWMVQKRQGNMVKKWGSRGKENGQYRNPTGVAVHPRSGDFAVTDCVNNRIQIFRQVSTV
jgi:tripartite motif-containing protein 71